MFTFQNTTQQKRKENEEALFGLLWNYIQSIFLEEKKIQKVHGKKLQLKKGRKIKIHPFLGVYIYKINTGSIQETKINVYVVKIQNLYFLKLTVFFFFFLSGDHFKKRQNQIQVLEQACSRELHNKSSPEMTSRTGVYRNEGGLRGLNINLFIPIYL